MAAPYQLTLDTSTHTIIPSYSSRFQNIYIWGI